MKVVRRNSMWNPSILDELFPQNRLESLNYERFSIPKVNIKENFSTFVIELAVPGLSKDSFDIEIEKEVLKVSSKVSPKEESTDTETKTQFTRKEFNYNNFTRSFNLPEAVNMEDVKASYIDGILSISLPKKEVKKDIKRMVEIS
jgi:HSP20 family protein|tara:strand:+ start:70 stop:504 length:435 start_codon:yes stop_codon:yes gene_type:complete